MGLADSTRAIVKTAVKAADQAGQTKLIRIFLASPGDVAAERELARQLIDNELEKIPAFREQLALEVIAYEDPNAPVPLPATHTPQESVIKYRPRPAICDIVVIILWSRLGTPPKSFCKNDGTPYLSGTEWEFEDAVNSTQQPKPEILVYRCIEKAMAELDDPDLLAKRSQFEQVKAFFLRMGNENLGFTEYKTPLEFRDRLRKDLEEILWLRRPELATEKQRTGATGVQHWEGAPYPGLRVFKLDEKPIFCGREQETNAMIARLQDPNCRFLVIVGNSGIGKSSLIFAGLLPLLKAGAINGWPVKRVVICRPGDQGTDPFLAVANELDRELSEKPKNVAEELFEHPKALGERLTRGLSEGSIAVFIVDQLEELFTLCDKKYEQSFAQALQALADPRVRVLATLRADYLTTATCLEPIKLMLQDWTVPLAPPGTVALAEMISKPAKIANIDFDDKLTEEILKDAGADAGALPMIAFCLYHLYDTNKGRKLDIPAYETIGRLRGAVGGYAKDKVEELKKEEEIDKALPLLFEFLVAVDAAGKPTRCRAEKSTLPEEASFVALLDALLEARLLLPSGSEAERRVELAHEALFEGWPVLKEWIEQNRKELMREAKLSADAVRWEEENRDTNYLLPKGRLYDAITFLETKRGKKASEIIMNFVEKSKEVVDKEAEEMRRQIENNNTEFLQKLSADLSSDLANWERNGHKNCDLLQGDRLKNVSSFAFVLEPRIKDFVARSQDKVNEEKKEVLGTKISEFMSSFFPKGADE